MLFLESFLSPIASESGRADNFVITGKVNLLRILIEFAQKTKRPKLHKSQSQ